MVAVVELIGLLLHQRRRVVLYLGAGCSRSVRWQVGRAIVTGVGWKELLTRLFDRISAPKKKKLLREMQHLGSGGKVGFDDLWRSFDKLQLARHISSQFSPKERDEAIKSIVEPPGWSNRESDLLPVLLDLPYRDIITTNYDTNLEYFLEKSRTGGRRLVPGEDIHLITDANSIRASYGKSGKPRLVYLHGRIQNHFNPSERSLILDRFDYARLLNGWRGLLGFVTGILRESHVLYVGFDLDDPSFNLIEAQLYTEDGDYRPAAYAFVEHATTVERTEWERRNLKLIEIGDLDTNLPIVVDSIRTILEYFHRAQTGLPRTDEAGFDDHFQEAIEAYLTGDFEASWKRCRAALASTIFWGRSGQDLTEEQAKKICDVRLRLALVHYKLHSSVEHTFLDHWNPEQVHDALMRHSMDEARKLITTWSKDNEASWVPYQSSLDNIEARLHYHSGDYDEAEKVYNKIVDASEEAMPGDRERDFELVVARFRLLEASYYAQCQLSRIEYQLLKPSEGAQHEERPPDHREQQFRKMSELADCVQQSVAEIEELLQNGRKIWPFWDSDHTMNYRLDYLRRSLGSIRHIARWTAGRHSLGCFAEVFPLEHERKRPEYRERLHRGIILLEFEPDEPKHGFEADESTEDEKQRKPRDGTPSPRWQALRLRYLARGLALRWVISRIEDKADADDLLLAYRRLHQAFEVASQPGLARQQTVNYQEGARLNLLVLFAERIGGKCSGENVSALTRNAMMYYLDQSISNIEQVRRMERARRTVMAQEGEEQDGSTRQGLWLLAIADRLVSYAVLLTDNDPRLRGVHLHSRHLRKFLKWTPERQRRAVAWLYRLSCGRGNEARVAERIRRYQQYCEQIAIELRSSSADAYGVQ